MAVKTNNIYGKIIISNNTIGRFVAHMATDCYGIVSLVPSDALEYVISFFKFKSESVGVKVRAQGDRIFIDVSVVVKYGMPIKAVVDTLKESIKYKVERFTGMIVDTINVFVKGVQR